MFHYSVEHLRRMQSHFEDLPRKEVEKFYSPDDPTWQDSAEVFLQWLEDIEGNVEAINKILVKE